MIYGRVLIISLETGLSVGVSRYQFSPKNILMQKSFTHLLVILANIDVREYNQIMKVCTLWDTFSEIVKDLSPDVAFNSK